MKRTAPLAVGLFLLLQFSPAQEKGVPAFVKDSLDAYIQRAMANWQIPGAAVCVIRDGKPDVMKGYGVRALGSAEKVDEHTLFLIGSNTKAFTSTSLAMLASDRKLSLDDKVSKWLPDFKLENPLASAEVIIRDLLCHRLGLETFQGDFTYWTSNLTRNEVIGRLAVIKAPYSFRTKWGYTNAAFLAAGEIIPKVTGKTWEWFVKESLFVPLDMNRSHALAKEIQTATNAARSHTLVDGKVLAIPYCDIDNLAPAGSISSSVSDMSHWVIAQLDSGRYQGKTVFPQSVIDATRMPHSVVGMRAGTRFTKGHFSLYGLGWDVSEYGGKLLVGHTGGVNGFVTSVTMLPELRLGIVVLTNTDQNAFYQSLKYELLDAYLNLPFRNYDSLFLSFNRRGEEERSAWLKAKRDTIAMKPNTAVELNQYVGAYRNDVYGSLDISFEGGALIMHFSHHAMTGKLEPLGGNRFFCTYTDPIMGRKEIPFTVENGKVKSVTVYVDDFVEFTPYEFIKQ